jgi:hypothetical protein
MRPLKILGLILIFVLTFWGGMKCENELTKLDDIGKPYFKREHLYFDKLDTSLYIKTKTWGLTGDHSLTVISLDKTNEFTPDSLTEYIFNGTDIFYRQTIDSLVVYYTYMNSRPKQFDTNVRLKLIEIDNPTYHELNDKVKNGLRRIE